jgi:hypothetical protein
MNISSVLVFLVALDFPIYLFKVSKCCAAKAALEKHLLL